MVDWQPDALKEHVDVRFDGLDKRFDALNEQFGKLRKADLESVQTALASANEKAKTHNDILGAMRDQQATFITRELFNALTAQVQDLKDAAIKSGGRTTGLNQLGFAAVQAITTAIAVVGGIQLLG